jgi:hypothetical protein
MTLYPNEAVQSKAPLATFGTNSSPPDAIELDLPPKISGVITLRFFEKDHQVLEVQFNTYRRSTGLYFIRLTNLPNYALRHPTRMEIHDSAGSRLELNGNMLFLKENY